MTGTDHAHIYRSTRARIDGLVRDLPDDVLDQYAPATPSWRVRDVIAHLAGAVTDMLEGNVDGAASDAWTQAQVDGRRSLPIGAVLDAWAGVSQRFEPMIAGFDGLTRAMLLTDLVTHEHDVRGAIERPGARDSEGVAYAFRGLVGAIARARGDRGALAIVHDAGETVAGVGDVTDTVEVSRFEVVRAATGRRSIAQIEAWAWSGAPDPGAVVLPRFPARDTPLEE